MHVRAPCHSSFQPFSTCSPTLGRQGSASCHHSRVWGAFFRVLYKRTHVVCPLSCLASPTPHNWGSPSVFACMTSLSLFIIGQYDMVWIFRNFLIHSFSKDICFSNFWLLQRNICSKHLCTCLLHVKSLYGIIFTFLWSTHPVLDVWSK